MFFLGWCYMELSAYQMAQLRSYITEQNCDDKCYRQIYNIIDEYGRTTDIEQIVYRGHGHSKAIAPKYKKHTLWFSVSTSKRVARDDFSNFNKPEHCCVFTVHLMKGVRYIIVNDFISTNYTDEQEWLVEGDGTFYQDSRLLTVGFKPIADGEFETWYSMRGSPPSRPHSHAAATKKTAKVIRQSIDEEYVASQISDEELELIETVEDLKILLPQYVDTEI